MSENKAKGQEVLKQIVRAEGILLEAVKNLYERGNGELDETIVDCFLKLGELYQKTRAKYLL